MASDGRAWRGRRKIWMAAVVGAALLCFLYLLPLSLIHVGDDQAEKANETAGTAWPPQSGRTSSTERLASRPSSSPGSVAFAASS